MCARRIEVPCETAQIVDVVVLRGHDGEVLDRTPERGGCVVPPISGLERTAPVIMTSSGDCAEAEHLHVVADSDVDLILPRLEEVGVAGAGELALLALGGVDLALNLLLHRHRRIEDQDVGAEVGRRSERRVVWHLVFAVRYAPSTVVIGPLASSPPMTRCRPHPR